MWPKIKNSIFLNIILLGLAVWAGLGAVKMAVQAFSLHKEAQDDQRKIEELSRKKTELEAYIAELQSREAIEREAKKRLNLKLPGEEVVVVVPEEGSNGPESTEKSIWEKIKFFSSNLFGL